MGTIQKVERKSLAGRIKNGLRGKKQMRQMRQMKKKKSWTCCSVQWCFVEEAKSNKFTHKRRTRRKDAKIEIERIEMNGKSRSN